MTGEHGEGVRVFGRLWHGRVGKTKPFACFVDVVFFFGGGAFVSVFPTPPMP
jgi:hypothetical protein